MYGGRARVMVAAGFLAALLALVLAGCSTARAAMPSGHRLAPGSGASSAPSASAASSPVRAPTVQSLRAGTVIAPGADAVLGESAGVLPARQPTPGGTPTMRTLRELQMNLCNSGEASCYTGGRAVDEASALMRGAALPDMVTVNEVCRRDVTERLGGVMSDLWPHDDIVYLFAPAVNSTGGSFRCQNGDVFGNGLLARVPAGHLAVLPVRYGLFTAQITVIERRTFGCVYLRPRLVACVTHLESDSAAVATTQCTVLMSGVVPAMRRDWGATTPVIVAGDMNLSAGIARCTPPGFQQMGDGALQHVLASAGTQFQRVDLYPMRQTDHNALLVTLALPQP